MKYMLKDEISQNMIIAEFIGNMKSYNSWVLIEPVVKAVRNSIDYLWNKENTKAVKLINYKVHNQLCLFLEQMALAVTENSIDMMHRVIVKFVEWQKENI